jgi:hypothetical protein
MNSFSPCHPDAQATVPEARRMQYDPIQVKKIKRCHLLFFSNTTIVLVLMSAAPWPLLAN